MGYSKSIATVRKRYHLLVKILRRDQEVRYYALSEEEADSIAYKLRECFYIARRKRAELPDLAARADEYTITVRGRIVTATRPATATAAGATERAGAQTVRQVLFGGTAAEVIQHWIDHSPDTAPLEVIDAPLDKAGEAEVVRCLAGMTPPWKMTRRGRGLRLEIEASKVVSS